MLSRLLNVRHPTAKQAVITAIDLLGLSIHFNAVRRVHNMPVLFLLSCPS